MTGVGPRRRGAHPVIFRREAFTIRQADGAAAPCVVTTTKAIDTCDAIYQVHGTIFDPINSADLCKKTS